MESRIPIGLARRGWHRPVVCVAILLFGSAVAADDDVASGANHQSTESSAAAPAPDFRQDVRPILAENCFACHGADEASREADLELDNFDAATRELDSGTTAIVPGHADRSELIERVVTGDPDLRMPPPDDGEPLTDRQVDILRAWIDAGAHYVEHWSYVRPVRPLPPLVAESTWCRNSIDAFVLAKLEAAGLAPAPAASRERLIRRLSLDVTGLPPTLEEVDAFLHDDRPDAYDRLVDRLLTSPAYGEHWARKWLDLARYADSQGYAQDEPRTIWRYRDWLIGALNRDLPYDQFTAEQLAGDLLPNPTIDQRLATAFHRNTMTNTEGGTDDEEFRHAAVIDRVNTTMQVWMGLTMGCAQCHSHKYDPITLEDYYRVFAVFNQTEDNDQPDNRPTIPTPTDRQQRRLDRLNNERQQWEQVAESDERTRELERLRKALAEFEKQIPTTPVMRELPAEKRRENHVFLRGSFLTPGELVEAGVPQAFGGLETDGEVNRLALARWLVSPANPLTARVAVNRQWELLFGRGLVETSEDFGTQGSAPSHPKLLDWLATELIDKAWSRKRLVKTIVMSATYWQSPAVTAEKLARDRDNRLLSRGARYRLTAEQIRDQALAASGLLSHKMFGSSVHPPQPKSGLGAAFGSSLDWEPSPGEDRYRRGLYTMWRRVAPYPSMMALDATGRSTCTIRRVRTNTPVGAFVTLNDPVFIEAAQLLARRMVEHGGRSPEQCATVGFRRVLARPPSDPELSRLVALYEQALDHYANDPLAAEKMATEPCGPLPPDMAADEAAAWTVVANVLLNLDEVLTRN
ncbi:MAG: DUF1553 domain-containing protein [Pirellulales bacterium]